MRQHFTASSAHKTESFMQFTKQLKAIKMRENAKWNANWHAKRKSYRTTTAINYSDSYVVYTITHAMFSLVSTFAVCFFWVGNEHSYFYIFICALLVWFRFMLCVEWVTLYVWCVCVCFMLWTCRQNKAHEHTYEHKKWQEYYYNNRKIGI